MVVPLYDCTGPISQIKFIPSAPPLHPLQAPGIVLPASPLRTHLDTAAGHIRSSRLVAFPTETVYGLGASTSSPSAVKSVYELKGRPSDNPLIVHVSSLSMLYTLTPANFAISELYLALISAFWPGPLTLLFPSKHPPPLPAPQTTAIRIPGHPLARALIHIADTPISAPSANSSGRPSPTQASHVSNDLGQKPHPNPLGCILDGGSCDVGVESTVITGLDWSKEAGGGALRVLRPGGVGIEQLERICSEVDEREGTKTRIWVHGRAVSHGKDHPAQAAEDQTRPVRDKQTNSPDDQAVFHPTTPGMKYKHYSPSVPVYLLYPTNTFTSTSSFHTAESMPLVDTNSGPSLPQEVLRQIANHQGGAQGGPFRLGVMHFEASPLQGALSKAVSSGDARLEIQSLSLGTSAEDAARALFRGMLTLEGQQWPQDVAAGPTAEQLSSVNAILIEACSMDGLGMAVMERAGKAAGGGGSEGGLDHSDHGEGVKRFWVQV